MFEHARTSQKKPKLKMFNKSEPNSAKLLESFTDPNLMMQTLDNLIKSYVQSIKTGSWSKAGWPDCAYSVTKMAVNCYTKLLQEKLVPSQTWNHGQLPVPGHHALQDETEQGGDDLREKQHQHHLLLGHPAHGRGRRLLNTL